MSGERIFTRHKRNEMMAWLSDVARKCEPCPTNEQIAERFNFDSGASSTRLLHVLEDEGLIRVERFAQSRVVTILADGRQTKRPAVERPHWRLAKDADRRVRRMAAGTQTAGHVEGQYRGPVPEHQRVNRDACPNCGVRRDVGCSHSGQRVITGAFGL